MSKLDVGVGDEFPLDEDNSDPDPDRGHRHGRHRHRHGFHGRGHHGHHHRHHFYALPLLLILGGVAALMVAGKISVSLAYAMIGLGVVLLAVLAFAGVRHWRRFQRHIRSQAQ